MGFSIRHLNEEGLPLVVLQDDTSATQVAILSEHGATLHAFRVNGKNGSFNVIDNYHDLAELTKEMSHSFKGPKLSPFPCRIAGAAYRFEDKQYSFSNGFGDGTAIHGLLYNKSFDVKLEEAGEASAALVLEYLYKGDDPGYPHTYSCQVRYELFNGNLLEVSTTVTNQGTSSLPIADGWHPYFQLGGSVNDWTLQFNAKAIVEFNEQLIPTGHILPYGDFNSGKPIGDSFLDNSFVLDPAALHPACELANPASGLKISFFPDAGYPYLQIYTPPSRKSIAIENLSGAPDCFNNKMGLIILSPGHSQTFRVKYKVSIG